MKAMLKAMLKPLSAVVLSAGLVAGAHSQAPDVGLVNLLQGDVTWQSDCAQGTKAQTYMKVRQGDRFTVPAGAQVRLVYFQGGRQETWRGPAAFRTGMQQSDVVSGQAPQVNQLPAAVAQRIQQAPDLVQVARLGRSGGVLVRGKKVPELTAAQRTELGTARDTYKTLRAQAAANDIMPEMYLYSVLQDLQLHEEAKPVVAEMAKRQPDNADVKAMVEYVKWRTE